MHTIRLRAAAALAFLALLLTGCATPVADDDLEVTLVNVRPAADGGGAGEAALTFEVRIQNASPEAVTLTGASHKIYLNGLYIGQGLTGERIEVGRLSTGVQEVTVHLGTFRLARAGYRVYRERSVAYEVRSTLYREDHGRMRRQRVTQEGTLDLSGLDLPPLPPGAPPL